MTNKNPTAQEASSAYNEWQKVQFPPITTTSDRNDDVQIEVFTLPDGARFVGPGDEITIGAEVLRANFVPKEVASEEKQAILHAIGYRTRYVGDTLMISRDGCNWWEPNLSVATQRRPMMTACAHTHCVEAAHYLCCGRKYCFWHYVGQTTRLG